MTEVFKPIPGWPEYKVSNFGRVKSIRTFLKPWDRSGYEMVEIRRNGKRKNITVHQLVAMAFLGHKPNGNNLVINHRNFNKRDNRLNNLEIVTNRENANKKHLNSSSKYTGVNYQKNRGNWQSSITIDYKKIHLGTFINPYWAHLAYQQKLRNLQT